MYLWLARKTAEREAFKDSSIRVASSPRESSLSETISLISSMVEIASSLVMVPCSPSRDDLQAGQETSSMSQLKPRSTCPPNEILRAHHRM